MHTASEKEAQSPQNLTQGGESGEVGPRSWRKQLPLHGGVRGRTQQTLQSQELQGSDQGGQQDPVEGAEEQDLQRDRVEAGIAHPADVQSSAGERFPQLQEQHQRLQTECDLKQEGHHSVLVQTAQDHRREAQGTPAQAQRTVVRDALAYQALP